MLGRTLAILWLIMPLWTRAAAAPLAVQGRADLSAVDWQNEPIKNLVGDWQFYWDQLLTPADLAAGQGKLTAFLSPEKQWHKTELPGVNLQRWGAATYHLRIHAHEPMNLMLAIPVLNSASRVWINNELKQSFGEVTLADSGKQGFVRPNLLPFPVRQGENTVTIQISNFLFWFGGSSLPLRLGTAEAMNKEELRASLQDALSFGFILFMAIYHIYIRVLLKRSNGALYFGLLSLAIALRMGLVGEGKIFYQLWPEIPMALRYRIEYLGVALATAYAMVFYRELYPKEAPNLVYRPLIYLSFAWALMIALTPASVYPSLLESFQFIILGAGLLAIVTSALATKHGRDGARILLASNFFFFGTIANDIFYHHRILNSIPLLHYGLMILMCSQALILAQRFARAYDRAERAEHEVTQLNLGLEEKIVERTEQINTILAHVRSGFLLVDRDSRLQTGFTSSCESILSRQLKVGSSLPEQLEFNARLQMQFMLAIRQIFDSDLPTEVAMQQLPARFPIDTRMVGLQAAAVKSRDKSQVNAVLLTINDVTDLVAAEEGLRRADILIHILEDQDAFRIFLADFKKDIETAAQAIVRNDNIALQSMLHTMKGNAASFNLEDWVQRLHELEEKTPMTVQDLQSITDHVRGFLRENEGILHLDLDHPMRTVFGVDQSDLNALKEGLETVISPLALTRLEAWASSVKALPLKSYTTPLAPMVSRVARQLQKNVSLVVDGADAKVDNAFAPLLTTLPHLIRNALVHGIEDPEERGSKPPRATITLRFLLLADGGLQIDIHDDGRGLDRNQIREHAVNQGLISRTENLREEGIFELIFHPSFSTAERVTDLAGRGMGLAAVAAAIHELGGRYEVKSKKYQGFHLHISVPAPLSRSLNRAS